MTVDVVGDRYHLQQGGIVGHFENGHFIPSDTKTQRASENWDQKILVQDGFSISEETPVGYSPSGEPLYRNSTLGQQQRQTSDSKDQHWIRRSFLNWRKTPETISRGRSSPAKFAYTDTTLGGDIAINPQFQYTRFADIRARQIVRVGQGIGRFYYEQIWQNRHDIHIRFGYQMFANGFVFFSRWYDYQSDRLSRTGRAPGWLFSIGRVAGWYINYTVPAFFIGMNIFKAMAAYAGQSRYCYVKSGMPQYWGAVNNLVNSVAANMAITLPVSEEAQIENLGADKKPETVGDSAEKGQRWANAYLKTLPSVYATNSWDGGFSIDMMKISTRAQRLHNMSQRLLKERLEAITEKWKDYQGNSVSEAFAKYLNENMEDDFINAMNEAMKPPTFKTKDGESRWGFSSVIQYLWSSVKQYMSSSDENGHSTTLQQIEEDKKKKSTDIDAAETTSGYFGNKENGDVDDTFMSIYAAQQDNGADWISFRVNSSKSVSESFSNSATESEVASAFNSFAKVRQKMIFNFAGGSFMGDTIKGVVNGFMDIAMGALSAVGLGGLGGIITGAQIDIPKQWDNSSVTLPRLSYEINLRTPYGNPLSVFQAIMVPLLCLIAGTAPISRGRNAFGTPFYCEVYDKGAWQVKMGCIGSLSITRGVGNVPWSRERQPLGVDVSLEILDMSTTMSVPIMARQGVSDLVSSALSGGEIWDDISVGSDTPIDDYLFALSGMGLVEQLYNTNRLSRNWGKMIRQWQNSVSFDSIMSDVINNTPLHLFQIFHKGTLKI